MPKRGYFCDGKTPSVNHKVWFSGQNMKNLEDKQRLCFSFSKILKLGMQDVLKASESFWSFVHQVDTNITSNDDRRSITAGK